MYYPFYVLWYSWQNKASENTMRMLEATLTTVAGSEFQIILILKNSIRGHFVCRRKIINLSTAKRPPKSVVRITLSYCVQTVLHVSSFCTFSKSEKYPQLQVEPNVIGKEKIKSLGFNLILFVLFFSVCCIDLFFLILNSKIRHDWHDLNLNRVKPSRSV